VLKSKLERLKNVIDHEGVVQQYRVKKTATLKDIGVIIIIITVAVVIENVPITVTLSQNTAGDSTPSDWKCITDVNVLI